MDLKQNLIKSKCRFLSSFVFLFYYHLNKNICISNIEKDATKCLINYFYENLNLLFLTTYANTVKCSYN